MQRSMSSDHCGLCLSIAETDAECPGCADVHHNACIAYFPKHFSQTAMNGPAACRYSYVVEDGGRAGARASIARQHAPAAPYTRTPGPLKQIRGAHAHARKKLRQNSQKTTQEMARSGLQDLLTLGDLAGSGVREAPAAHSMPSMGLGSLLDFRGGMGDQGIGGRATSLQDVRQHAAPAWGEFLDQSAVPRRHSDPFEDYNASSAAQELGARAFSDQVRADCSGVNVQI